ncbi:MAG: iron-containing alcohol dehydrogenase [Chloroflexota bacterium]
MKPSISTYVWPGQTHFGFGAAGLTGQEAKARRARRVFIVADPGVVTAGLVEPVESSLKAAGLSYGLYDRVTPNPDLESIDAAVAAFRESKADLIVGIGGGSGLDTAKALRLVAGGPPEGRTAEYSLVLGDKARPVPPPAALPPFIAIPTTAGTGSEVTPWAVITNHQARRKFGVGGPDLAPTVALVDPELTLTLPPFLTAATGMDALTHCIEAYVSTNDNPMLDPMILYGIELIGRSLRVAVAQGANQSARRDMALASLMGGIGISSKWLGACHSLAHPLSALADVQHGLANAMMLPHQMAYSLPGALERYARLGEALDAPRLASGPLTQRARRAVEAVRELAQDIDLPTRLSEVGVTEALLPQLAQAAYRDSNWLSNPRRVTEAVMEKLYREAY